MNWAEQVDGYCERTDFSYWSEPINAVTNAAFLIVALIMWRRSLGNPSARVLCAILFAIGVGSYLFHTHATQWAGLADVAPIGVFILTYIFLTNRDIVGWPSWLAAIGTLAFIPYAAALLPILDSIAFIEISNFYWTVPILLIVYAIFLRRRFPRTARGFVFGAALLCISIILRSLDEIWCDWLPMGTHFAWHCLNAVMLGTMIEVYRRHVLAARATQR